MNPGTAPPVVVEPVKQNKYTTNFVGNNINLMQFWPDVRVEKMRLSTAAKDIKITMAFEKKKALEAS